MEPGRTDRACEEAASCRSSAGMACISCPAKSSSEKKWTVGGKKAVEAADARVPAENVVSMVAVDPASDVESLIEPASEARLLMLNSEAAMKRRGSSNSRACQAELDAAAIAACPAIPRAAGSLPMTNRPVQASSATKTPKTNPNGRRNV
eukprot:scaffold18151_cov112-Isochrysis_galbana.AAC.2